MIELTNEKLAEAAAKDWYADMSLWGVEQLTPVIASRYAPVFAELKQAKDNHTDACALVAKMHAAAVGEVRGPKRGVVEDVEDLRSRLARLVEAANSLAIAAMNVPSPVGCEEGCGCPISLLGYAVDIYNKAIVEAQQ